jgi:hypothetical protein
MHVSSTGLTFFTSAEGLENGMCLPSAVCLKLMQKRLTKINVLFTVSCPLLRDSTIRS